MPPKKIAVKEEPVDRPAPRRSLRHQAVIRPPTTTNTTPEHVDLEADDNTTNVASFPVAATGKRPKPYRKNLKKPKRGFSGEGSSTAGDTLATDVTPANIITADVTTAGDVSANVPADEAVMVAAIPANDSPAGNVTVVAGAAVEDPVTADVPADDITQPGSIPTGGHSSDNVTNVATGSSSRTTLQITIPPYSSWANFREQWCFVDSPPPENPMALVLYAGRATSEPPISCGLQIPEVKSNPENPLEGRVVPISSTRVGARFFRPSESDGVIVRIPSPRRVSVEAEMNTPPRNEEVVESSVVKKGPQPTI